MEFTSDPPAQSPAQPPEDKHSVNELFSLVYEELHSLAHQLRRGEVHATIRSTALLHHAWEKLRNSPAMAFTSAEHFKGIAAHAMRQVLVDEARRRKAHKRGGQINFVSFDEAADNASAEQLLLADEELLALDSSLAALAARSPRQAQMVECRFFLGLSVAETAAVLGVSASAIERDWRAARAWLAAKLRPAGK